MHIWSALHTITLQVAAGAAAPPAYGGEYAALLVAEMEKQHEEGTADASRREALSRQVEVLRRLSKAVEARQKPAGSDSNGSNIRFDEDMDEAEVLLRLFREVDTDRNGRASLDEMLAAPQLRNSEILRVLRRAVGCNLAALEEALLPLKGEDAALQGSAAGGGVKAVFEAIGPSRGADIPVQPSDDEGDDRMVTRADLERFIGSKPTQCTPALATALKTLASTLAADEQLDFLAFKVAATQVPRVAAQRLEWVRSMALDEALARHLPPGTLDDG